MPGSFGAAGSSAPGAPKAGAAPAGQAAAATGGFNLAGGTSGAAAAKQPVPQKTMMGMTSPFAGAAFPRAGASEPARAPEAGVRERTDNEGAAAPDRRAPAPAGEPAPKRTMLGVAPPTSAAGAARSVPAELKQTMLGVAPPADVRAALQARSAAREQNTVEARGPAREQKTVEARGPAREQDNVAAASPAGGPVKVSPQTDRTMLGIPTATPSAPASDEAEDAVAASSEDGEPAHGFSLPDERSSTEASAPRGSGALRAVLAALAGALAVLAAGFAAWHFLRGPEIALRVVSADEGEQLEVQVPDAKPGTKVRFLGAERELSGGVARFPLTADALGLGDNELAIGIVRAGDVASTSVRLHVGYRARIDLAPMAEDPPALTVVIEALPGSKASVDGEALQVDANGRASKRYPIAAQTGTKFSFTARYRVEPKEGAANEGALAVNLPVTSVQIDRPGPTVTSDQPEIEVAGAVESGAVVTIDGHDAKANEGRFLHRVQLPKPGDYEIRVVARAPGKVPRALDIKVTRVEDLTLAAAGFQPDPSLTYARIAQNPVIYRGQNVAFDGRVYNVEVKAGVSHLQMLVQDCPGTQRCPLWVELPQATEATVDSWVRVLGTVAGEQQFRSERGQVHTVPSVQAQYVLKLAR